MRAAFFTSGGRSIGFGHIRRCLSLAQALQNLNIESVFLFHGDSEIVDVVVAAGYQVELLSSEQDLQDSIRYCREHHVNVVVVDSYSLSTAGLWRLRDAIGYVAVLDDLADRDMPVDLVINGSAGAERLCYRGMPNTAYLLGPRYLVLRKEFSDVPIGPIADSVARVLITVGGSDQNGLTRRLMRWTSRAVASVRQDIVVGPLFEHVDDLKAEARTLGEATVLHENSRDIRSLMLASDLALCAGGQTAYELAATGTPAVAVRTAKNQTINLEGLRSAGSLIWAGDVEDQDLEAKVTCELLSLAQDASRRAEMSRAGRMLVDGLGADRVAQALMEFAGTSGS